MFEYNAKLDRVVDGDTIDCIIDLGFDIHFKTRVRLLGINAPESRTRDKEEKKRGLAAKQWLIDLLKEHHSKFRIETSLDKKGKYGRVLGIIKIPELQNPGGNIIWRNVNQLMITEGHAVEYNGGKRK